MSFGRANSLHGCEPSHRRKLADEGYPKLFPTPALETHVLNVDNFFAPSRTRIPSYHDESIRLFHTIYWHGMILASFIPRRTGPLRAVLSWLQSPQPCHQLSCRRPRSSGVFRKNQLTMLYKMLEDLAHRTQRITLHKTSGLRCCSL